MKRIQASIAFDGVERAEIGGPPTAFRIWREGDNTTDHCPSFFSERSAALLLEEQVRRANRYSIDVNHLSLDKTAPLENQRAVGWFSIAVRDGELWAIDVEWTDTVRPGLCKEPPEWRYHSPAYDVDPESHEIVSLLNLAITNTPATWGVTALASRGATKDTMKLEDIKAAFDGADEDKKAAAWKAIAAAMASGGVKAADDKDDAGDGTDVGAKASADSDDAPDSKKEAKKASHDDDAPDSKKEAKKAAADDAEKKDSKAVAASSDFAARLAALEARQETDERKSIIASREMPKPLAETLAKMPLEHVRSVCASLPPKARKDLAAAIKVEATQGAGQGTGTSALPITEKQKLDEKMGLRPVRATVRVEGNHQIFPVLTPAEAREVLAKKDVQK